MRYRNLIAGGFALLLSAAGTAEARLIELEDFSWGLPLLEVERRAEDHGFRLREKDISQPKPRLEYEAFLLGMNCLLSFSFTPMSGKLYEVAATWDRQEFGTTLKGELTRVYGEPREEIPGAGISIWTRRITELTLRSGRGRTTLTYCHLLLKKDAREEQEVIRKEPVKRSEFPESYGGGGETQDEEGKDNDPGPSQPQSSPSPPAGGG